MGYLTAQQLGLGNIGLGSSGQAAVRQAASTLNYGASNPGTAAVSSPTSGGSATKLSLTGQTGYQPPSQNLPSFSVNQQGTVTSPPPAPAHSINGIMTREDILPPSWAAYTEPSHPPFTDESGGDTEFGKLLKLMRNDPNHPYNIRRYAELMAEWQAAHPQPTMPAPTAAPPPVMPQVAITQPKPVGATAALPSVSPTTGAGVSGQAFPALTQQAGALKGLQMPGLGPQSLVAPLINKAMDIWNQQIQPNVRLGSWKLPELGITEQIQRFLGNVEPFSNVFQDTRTWQGGSKLNPFRPKDEGELLRLPPSKGEGYGTPEEYMKDLLASTDISQLGKKEAITRPELSTSPTGQPQLQMQPETAPEKKYGAMSQILPAEQHGQAIQMYVSGQAPKEDVVAAIASPEAKITIGKMINQAVKAGDMYSVAKLAELPPAIDQNIQFIQMIGRAVLAQAQGFGTPNAPGVTEARMPMVEMGTAQALTTPPTFAQAVPAGQTGVQRRPWTPPYFQPETQQQRPRVSPYMV